VGGGALLRGIDLMIQKETDLDVRIAEDPMTAVARGTGEVLNQLDLLRSILVDAS